MPTSDRLIAPVTFTDATPFGVASTPRPGAGAKCWTPVFIVASARPLTGKTFLARLITDFLRMDGAAVAAFDLNPAEGSLADYRPALTTRADISSTAGEMALFDRLIMEDGVAKVVDLGHGLFQRFFALIEEIGFIGEADRRAIEPVIVYPADPHPASVQGYASLVQRFPHTVLVPVFNEPIVKKQKLRDQYPFTRAAAVPLQIPLLPPALKVYAEKSAYSFADFHDQLPVDVPFGHAFELRAWTKRCFLEFRELELRMLLEKLRASLQR